MTSPDPNSNPTSQSSNSEEQKKGLIEAIKDQKTLLEVLILIGGIMSSSFAVGFAFKGLVEKCLTISAYNKLSDKANQAEQLIADNNQLVQKNQELEERISSFINCDASITKPSDGETVSQRPNIDIEVGKCTQTRVWLIAIPNANNDTGNDCYLIGEATRGKKSTLNASPLQQSKPYIVRLIKNNKNISNIPKNSRDGYSCSDIEDSNSLDEIRLTVQ